MVKDHADKEKKEGNLLFNDALNTFCIYGYMVKDHSDKERKEGNLLFNDHSTHFVFMVIW